MSVRTKEHYLKPADYLDVLTAFGVLGIITLIILPIPAGVLDMLLTLNTTLSVVVLLLSMFTKEVL